MRAAVVAFCVPFATLATVFRLLRQSKASFPRWALVFPLTLGVACFSWASIVSTIVPEPYLDEVFHIPQAQKYCQGKFREWDDKITTPPGLYLLSIIVPHVVTLGNSLRDYTCTTRNLRLVNAIVLVLLSYVALLCRREIEARLYEARSSKKPRVFSQYAIHTAFNIGLFPLLFFFSGLYYTDVPSTAVVLLAYYNHLGRVARDRSSILNDVWTIVLGILALLMRQTNVFWIVVFMGGLEAVHAVKTLRPERIDQPYMATLSEQLKFFAWRYSIGDVHDPPLNMLWAEDMVFCVLSLGVAALCNPVRVSRQIWPYIGVIACFGSFVAWNGGVVLGDKSNHVATIHLAQMLYIWPFFAFFSLPLLLPYALSIVNVAIRLVEMALPKGSASKQSLPPATLSKLKKRASSRKLASKPSSTQPPVTEVSHPRASKELSTFICLVNSKLLSLIYFFFTILLSLLIVKYNTIIHPFTLADNRHYMFYIFRYTIRRGNTVRLLLVAPYTLARLMTWGTFAGCSPWFFSQTDDCSPPPAKVPFLSDPSWMNISWKRYGKRRDTRTRQSSVPFPVEARDEMQAAEKRDLDALLTKDPLALSCEPTSSSTALVFLLATALSLVTAPLVEPRYFIIPWVIWRLLVPAWRLHGHEGPGTLTDMLSRNALLGPVVSFFRRYDMRLIVETLWFIAINAVTGYIFLSKPYVWKAEDGTILDDGRLQRFMW